MAGSVSCKFKERGSGCSDDRQYGHFKVSTPSVGYKRQCKREIKDKINQFGQQLEAHALRKLYACLRLSCEHAMCGPHGTRSDRKSRFESRTLCSEVAKARHRSVGGSDRNCCRFVLANLEKIPKMSSILNSEHGAGIKPQLNGNGDVLKANGNVDLSHDEDAFQHLPNRQQEILLLHGPRQKYCLETTGEIPELRSEREILVQVSEQARYCGKHTYR